MLGVVAVGDVTDLPEQEDEFDTDSESDADNDTDIQQQQIWSRHPRSFPS